MHSAAIYKGEGTSQHQGGPTNKEDKGLCSPRTSRHRGVLCCRHRSHLPRLGCHMSPLERHIFIIIYNTYSSFPLYILANMMFDAIYYFLVIYCIVVSSFERLLVHGKGDIVHLMVAYMFFIFYNGLMYWCMSASICWGLHKVVNVGLT
jgi:hypothetical protein